MAANKSGPILDALKKQEQAEVSKDNDGKLRTESNAVKDQKLHGSLQLSSQCFPESTVTRLLGVKNLATFVIF